MKVLLIGKTEVDLFPFQSDSRHVMPGKAEGSAFEKRLKKEHPYNLETGEELIEFAGRLCYESFHLPSEATNTNFEYIQNIITQEHFSVLEHVSVTFYLEGVSRNLTHELIRHRHLSFSELSQRFVDMQDAKTVIPPAFGGGTTQLSDAHKFQYNHAVRELKDQGKTRKQAREAARYGLPQGMETKMVVSGNLRTWRELLPKRLSPKADAEIQEFARKTLDILKGEYPAVFADINYEES